MIKIGAKAVQHARSITLQLAEVAVPRDLWALNRIIDPDKTSIDDLIPTASIFGLLDQVVRFFGKARSSMWCPAP